MLTIYRASAGAGKTHRLTGEYLLLLFSQPGAYRRILAVTFTNKATSWKNCFIWPADSHQIMSSYWFLPIS